MSVVETVNAGPIEGTFKIDLSDGPGVYELRGYRGSGKSTVLAAVDLLSGHRVDVTLHDIGAQVDDGDLRVESYRAREQ